MSWREIAKPIIAKVIRENPGLRVQELKKLIRAEYPFGERAFHPYKIWCSEVRRQLGEEKPKRKLPARHTDTQAMSLFE